MIIFIIVVMDLILFFPSLYLSQKYKQAGVKEFEKKQAGLAAASGEADAGGDAEVRHKYMCTWYEASWGPGTVMVPL